MAAKVTGMLLEMDQTEDLMGVVNQVCFDQFVQPHYLEYVDL